jgi:tight adherence protein B
VTGLGWLALAAAVLVAGTPSALPVRILALAHASRVAPPAAARRSAARAVAWRRLVPCVAVAVVLATGLSVGPALALAVSAAGGAAALLVRDAGRAGQASRRHAELLAAVRLLVAELDAGSRPAEALRAAADAAPVHAATLHAAARAAIDGADPGAVLLADTQTRVLGVAWQVGERTGAALGGVLTHIARDLAALDEQRRAVAVALSGPRSSAAVLTGLPVVGIALAVAMGARPLPFLFGPGAGRPVCAVGVVLDAAGVLWMRRIVRRAQAAP